MVDRYNCYGWDVRRGLMRQENHGKWVDYSDYAALEAQLAERASDDERENKLATMTAPDNAPASEVLAYVLMCARLWAPEARIIGNARAGDIVRSLSALEATPPAPPGWSRETEDDGSEYLNPPNGWLRTELTAPPAPKVTETMVERGAIAAYEADSRSGSWAEWRDLDESDQANKSLKDQFRRYSRAALTAAQESAPKVTATHRHKKRGSEYRVLGQAQVQCSDGLTDYEVVTVYVGTDGEMWVRRKSEFEDGRFEALTAAQEAGKP